MAPSTGTASQLSSPRRVIGPLVATASLPVVLPPPPIRGINGEYNVKGA
jgi:hypothetical protein